MLAPPMFRLLAPLFLFVLALAATREVTHLTVLGHDSWLLIQTSQIESPSDVVRHYREPFLSGHFRLPYYRPTLAHSVGLDTLLSGLEPRRLQVASQVWFALSVLAFFAMLKAVFARLFPTRARAGFACAVFGAALVAVHPIAWEIVPILNRRTETLVLLFGALAVRGSLGSSTAARWGGALALFLALGAKEVAYLLPPLLVCGALLGAGARGRRIERVLPIAIATLLALGLRASVVGLGLDEHAMTWSAPKMDLLALPVDANPLEERSMLRFGTLALVALFAVMALLPRRARSLGPEVSTLGSNWSSTLYALAALAFGVGAATLPSMRGIVGPWHAWLPTAAGVFVVSLGVLSTLDRSRSPWVSGMTLLSSVLLLSGFAWGSPLVRDHPEWRAGSRRVQAFLAVALESADGLELGERVELPPVPTVQATSHRSTTRAAFGLLSGKSVRAYIELHRPDPELRVAGPIGRMVEPRRTKLLVLDVDILDKLGSEGDLRRQLALCLQRSDDLGVLARDLEKGYRQRDFERVETRLRSAARQASGRALALAFAEHFNDLGDPTWVEALRRMGRTDGSPTE